MATHPFESPDDSSTPSDSVLSPIMPVSVKKLVPLSHLGNVGDDCLVPLVENRDGSLPNSDTVALDEGSMVPLASNLSASLPFSPMKNLDDHSCVPSLSDPVGSSRFSSATALCDQPIVPSSLNADGVSSPIQTYGNNDHSNSSIQEESQVNSSPSTPIYLYSNHSTNTPFSQRPSFGTSETSSPLRYSSKETWPSWSPSRENKLLSAISVAVQDTKPSAVGAGLANLGNTCFMNAILQCFTHTVPLVQSLRSANHTTPCCGGSEAFCVLCALRDHIEHSLASLGGIISPMKLVNNLNHFSSYFQRYQQEDAHEFLQCCLDRLERCCMNLYVQDTEKDNLVEKIFGGLLISKLQCCNCGHHSDTFEPLIDLSLEIEDVDSLSSAIKSFTKVETIEDSETKFTCENCKESVSVEKQLMLDKVPSVMAFHLKRFKTDGSFVEKIDKHIEFPLELDMQPYTVGNEDANVESKYELYAIVEHDGFSSTSGHYLSFIRSSPDAWYRFDDSKVTRVQEDYVLSREAYILFYMKQGTPWFSSLVVAQSPCLNPDVSDTSPTSVLEDMDSCHRSYFSRTCNADATTDMVGAISTELVCGMRSEVEESDGSADYTCEVAGQVCGPKQDEVSPDSKDASRVDISLPSTSHTNNETDEAGDIDVFHTLTPPRTPSPDKKSSASPGSCYRIPRNHLKSEKCTTERLPNKILDDSERNEAVRYIQRSMPSARGSKILALLDPRGEGGLNKRRRASMSDCKKATPPNTHRKRAHVMRYVTAEI